MRDNQSIVKYRLELLSRVDREEARTSFFSSILSVRITKELTVRTMCAIVEAFDHRDGIIT